MVHSIRSHERAHLQPNRIAGLAAAIALNAGFLMLLLVPLQTPPLPTLPTPGTVIRWIIAKPVKPVDPVPVPVTHARPTTHPIAATQPTTVAPNDPPVITDSTMGTQA